MTLQGRADLSRNQGSAAGRPATVHEPVVTPWAVHPPAPAHPSLPDKMEKAPPQPQHEGLKSKKHLPQQPAEAKTASRRVPRLRAVVESQAFKNILVDEMDMMHARAATLIQANWRGYWLRQKLISQMMAAKAIQEAWRRFNKRHILHSSKSLVKKTRAEEGDIPYHAPQQVRFQHPEENRLLSPPIMVNKETQFPSCDNLVLCRPQSSPLLQPPAAQGTPEPCVQAPHAARVRGVAFLPHQMVTIRFPCPVSLDAKCQPCLLTRTIRSTCLIHIEGDSVKTNASSQRHPPCLSQRPLAAPLTKASSQGHLPTELTKTPSLAHLDTCLSKMHSQTHLATGAVKVQSQAPLATCLTKTQSRGQPITDITTCLIPAHQAADLSSNTHSQVLLTGSKMSNHACQRLGGLSAPPWAKPEDRQTQPQPHRHVPGKTTQGGPCPAACEVQGMLVPLMAPTRHSTCNVESWRDNGATRAQPSMPGQAVPCQEDTGPADAGVVGGQSWNRAWEPARGAASWDTRRNKAVVPPRRSGEPMVSMQAAEEIRILAVITIQAGVRGYLVRRRIRLWHRGATVIQATWRGCRVRRNLAHLCRATTTIQSAWRGYSTRRDQARHRQMLHPVTWVELGSRAGVMSDRSWFQDGRARTVSDHRCFQSCQAHACSVCHSLSSRIGSPPSVVMLVGSSPRTCHTCGRTQPTRVVQGMGRGAEGPGAVSWASAYQRAALSPRQPHHQDKAATAIQSTWRGFKIRQQMRQQQMAAKIVQATWRGHHTRSCLKNTEALLGPADPWASSRHMHWPGV
ncbi:KIAA1683 isoform 1 [Pan troglodytes]|uniref:IQ domain-containing protein N n=1 Tax=Pan troglodytes TaxID=9598 RepID=A0A2J8LTE0_PANTR|nr:KIAA1683 isoform 1 [Pan troglodytes]